MAGCLDAVVKDAFSDLYYSLMDVYYNDEFDTISVSFTTIRKGQPPCRKPKCSTGLTSFLSLSS